MEVSRMATVMDYGAKGDGTTDDTDAIQKALDSNKCVRFPTGTYSVRPADGIVLSHGQTIVGDGEDASVIFPQPGKGSILKRQFDVGGKNHRVEYIYITGISVVMNHGFPHNRNAPGQIAFDFRNIGRSTIERCYAGNYNKGDFLRKNRVDPDTSETDNLGHPEAIQGFGVLLGTVPESSGAYAGGELNRIINCRVWGALGGIISDSELFSPNSAAHASVIRDCEVQVCEVGIAIESKWTAGTVIRDNTVQWIQKYPGSINKTIAYRIDGYDCTLAGGYTEFGFDIVDDKPIPQVTHVVLLGSESHDNYIQPFKIDDTVRNLVKNCGTNNRVELIANNEST